MFFKKSKITFYCTIDGLEKTMPIILSKEYKHEWLKKAHEKFIEKNLNVSKINKDGRIGNTSRCPGIITVKNQGWLLRTWQDIELKLDKDNYFWRTPLDQKNLSENYSAEQIDHHNESMLYDNFLNWPKDTFSKVIKINTPWIAKIPKGYVLYQFHPFYLDDNRFSVLPGCYLPEYGLFSINVPVFWHATKGDFFIKAGTPITQLILMKKEEINFNNIYYKEDKNFKKEHNISTILNFSSFKKQYNKIKEFYNK